MGTLKLCDDTQVLHLGVVVYVKISSSVSFPGEIYKLNIWKGSDTGGFESPEVRKKKIKNHLICIYNILGFQLFSRKYIKR
jgi:hypothetical protein